MMFVIQPKPIPVLRDRPWVSTSHGETPSPARIIIAIANP